METKKRVELLAPAGNMEKLKTAFHFGADACFVGGSAFNLRGMSSNFKNKELKEAVDYVHSLGKKIYVTLNIFAHNTEIEYMPRFIKKLDEFGVDAVIVAIGDNFGASVRIVSLLKKLKVKQWTLTTVEL